MIQIFSHLKLPSKSYLKKRFLFLIFGMVGFSGLFYFGSELSMNHDDAQSLLNSFESEVEGIDAMGIAIHNLSIALVMFVPGFGAGLGMISGFETGVIFSAYQTLYPQLDDFHALAILIFTPFGIMELIAYGIAISRSVIVLRYITSIPKLQLTLKSTLFELCFVAVLLFVAGFVEYFMIETLS